MSIHQKADNTTYAAIGTSGSESMSNVLTETLRTAEHVFPGHPDKVCDQISDAILDACLKEDPKARAAVEVLGSHGTLMIGGELTTTATPDYAKLARRVYDDLG